MANNINPSHPTSTIDPYKFLQLEQNQDGSVTRLTQTPSTQASSDPDSASLVLTKDCPLNPVDNTFLRLFLPKTALNTYSSLSKLPVIVYFHGGGFVFHHAYSTMFHDFCSELAVFTSSLVVSVEYRLAPEHRLPAAYDDSIDALRWIRASFVQNDDVHDHDQDEWLVKYGDCSKCFLMGSSAGGNIAYIVGLKVLKEVGEMGPLEIKGFILHQPYFGGVARTGSELNLIDDPYVPLSANDLFWKLSLPIGADRDHEYSNPKMGEGASLLNQMKELGWRVLVTGCSGDPLMDRQVELVKLLEEKGVTVKGHFTQGDYHAVEVFDHVKFHSFLVARDFMSREQSFPPFSIRL